MRNKTLKKYENSSKNGCNVVFLTTFADEYET